MEKPAIVLRDKPAKQIKWFTKNWDKEIGALGIGKLYNGQIIVEELCFPTQNVNGSHVHFEPSDWGPVMKELPVEKIQKICFFWHKHPDGCPGASQTDEDDTYGAFMTPESGRKFMGFLQTAQKSSTDPELIFEARIEIAKPLRASITEVDLVFDELETEIDMECAKIIKDKVTEGTKSSSDQPGAGPTKTEKKWWNDKTADTTGSTSAVQTTIPNTIKSIGENITTNQRPILNDLTNPVMLFESCDKNGAIFVKYSSYFSAWIDTYLSDPEVSKMISHTKHGADKERQYFITRLQPVKNCMDELQDKLDEIENNLGLDGVAEAIVAETIVDAGTKAVEVEAEEEEEGDNARFVY